MSAHLKRAVAALLALLTVGFAAFVGHWVLTGGRWYVVQTPSMGTAAPVGTLLWVEPLGHRSLHVGEFVSFRPPGSPTVYSHRIYRIEPDGSMRTKGQITPPDPWRIHRADVVGTVAMRWWGIGWVVKAAPLLILGGLALALLLRVLAREYRVPAAVVGFSLILCAAIVIYRPLVGAVQLAAPPTQGGQASYVSTGLLPIRIELGGGQHVGIAGGQVATVAHVRPDSAGHLAVTLAPHIPLWWWFVLLAPWFAPAVWNTVRRRTTPDVPRHRAATA